MNWWKDLTSPQATVIKTVLTVGVTLVIAVPTTLSLAPKAQPPRDINSPNVDTEFVRKIARRCLEERGLKNLQVTLTSKEYEVGRALMSQDGFELKRTPAAKAGTVYEILKKP